MSPFRGYGVLEYMFWNAAFCCKQIIKKVTLIICKYHCIAVIRASWNSAMAGIFCPNVVKNVVFVYYFTCNCA